jgi:type IV pilus assembly protein PilA
VKSSHNGFTLVELMVVMGIIAILSLMMLPSYLDKFTRDQIEQALSLADIAKAPVSMAWSATQSFPDDNAAAGLPSADKIVGNYVSSVSISSGAINITFGNRANSVIKGKVLTLRPAVVTDAPIVPVAWICGGASTPDKMTVNGENKTNIPVAYLPFSCRK